MNNLVKINYDEYYGMSLPSFRPYYLELNGYWFDREDLMEIKKKIDILLGIGENKK